MTFANPALTYEVTFQKAVGHDCSYQVKEWNSGKLSRTFTALISKTQQATAKGFTDGSAKKSIAKWCQLYPDRLPKDGGTVDVNLDEVQRT